MRLRNFCLILLLVVFLSCEKDFNVNAEWKDITIVYGLLDVNDTIHYIKINKAFLNEETSAIEVAGNIDSIHYSDSLTVILEEWVNGNHILDHYLYKEYNENKDSGIFHFEGQYLYRTSGDNTLLNPKATYVLKITNEETGKLISAEAGLIENLDPLRPLPNTKISFYPEGQIEVSWRTGKNAYFYNLEIYIYYCEREKGTSTWDTIDLRWPIFANRKTADLKGNDLIKTRILGLSFFNFMAQKIDDKSTIERKFIKFDFRYSAGGEEIYYYINVNKPSIGLIQKKPEYTNVNNGFGVFSSRNHLSFDVGLQNIDSLIEYKTTMNLNFIK